MDTVKKNHLKNRNGGKEAHVSDAASDLLNEGKKFANELYKEGLNQMNEVEENVHEYSDQLLRKVKENPLSSVLIAAGVGFLLSTFLKK